MYFTISSIRDGDYRKLEIDLYRKERGTALRFMWQGNNEFNGWYAPRIETGDDHSEHLQFAANVLHKLAKTPEGITPDNIITVAGGVSARRVYDSRLSEHVRPENVPDASLTGWRDDWQKLGASSCTVSALATDAQSAQSELEAHWLDYLSRTTWDKAKTAQKYADWVAAGRPVRQAWNETAPEVKPIESILNPV